MSKSTRPLSIKVTSLPGTRDLVLKVSYDNQTFFKRIPAGAAVESFVKVIEEIVNKLVFKNTIFKELSNGQTGKNQKS